MHQIWSHVIILEKATTAYMWEYLNMWLEDKRKMYFSPTHTLPLSWQYIQTAKINWDNSGLLGCATALLGKWFLTLLQHVRNHLSSKTMSHPSRLQCCEHLKKFSNQ